jgi:hypothetical protein
MNAITIQEGVDKIKALPAGSIYSVTFIKKDGTERLMNSIKGTARGVKGVGLSYDPAEKGLLPVYDLQQARKDPANPGKAWRSINLTTIKKIKCLGDEYIIS